jgi:hypothetical protein
MMRHDERVMPAAFLEEGVTLPLEGHPAPVRAHWIGTGFLAAHRRVFEALVARDDMALCETPGEEPFYPFYYPMLDERGGTTRWLGEDVSFCLRARTEGFQAYLNPGVRLIHVGSRPYRVEDLAPRGKVATPKSIELRRGEKGVVHYHLGYRPVDPSENPTIAEDGSFDLGAVPIGGFGGELE